MDDDKITLSAAALDILMRTTWDVAQREIRQVYQHEMARRCGRVEPTTRPREATKPLEPQPDRCEADSDSGMARIEPVSGRSVVSEDRLPRGEVSTTQPSEPLNLRGCTAEFVDSGGVVRFGTIVTRTSGDRWLVIADGFREVLERSEFRVIFDEVES